MNNRERHHAILNYEDYDRLPIVHFGYWDETLIKWRNEGHITDNEFNRQDKIDIVSSKLGFEYEYGTDFSSVNHNIYPWFESEVIKEFPDGSRHVRNGLGVVELVKPGVVSIPMELEHLLKDRESWETHYKHRFVYNDKRLANFTPPQDNRQNPACLFCGSLYGTIRNVTGVVGLSYIEADDEELYDEIVEVVGQLCYDMTKKQLESGGTFDYAHFWEDICYKNGPLVTPKTFYRKIGPHYRRITELLKTYDINIVSVDCDGMIDTLIPAWLDNGVNTMFPIEVGTWSANIAPWREQYGKKIRGVGGMNKNLFSYDYKAIDDEIERLKPLVALGGYIPCPDHRIPPDAKWENVQYYCEKMMKL